MTPPEYRIGRTPRFLHEIPPEAAAVLRLLPDDLDHPVDRRGFVRAGALGLGGLLAACGEDGPSGPGGPDFDLLAFCTEEVGAHQNVSNFAFSPDGRFVASGGTGKGDNHFKLWELETGRLVTSLSYSGSGFSVPVAFSGTGEFVAAHLPGRVVLVSVPEGTLRAEWEYTRQGWTGVFALALSGDGQRLAYDDDGRAVVLDTSDGSELVAIDTPTGGAQSLDLSADGSILAVAPYTLPLGSPVAYLYSVPDGQSLGELVDPVNEHSPVRRITLSSDARVLVSSSERQPITVWDVATRTIVRRIESNGGNPNIPGFMTHALDGSDNIYGMGWSGVEVFSLAGARLGGLEGLPWGRPVVLEPSPDGRVLVFGSGSSVRLYDVATGNFRNCFFDQEATARGGRLSYYSIVDREGREIWYTLPCGEAIPAGAACTCNCVSGSAPTPGGSSACGINFVCTCIPVIYGA